jgi:hypothetical protein
LVRILPIEFTDFDLWDFLDRNSKLFVTLGIFGAFTLYLNSFKEVIDQKFINFGILACLILILVIAFSILANAYKDLKIQNFPMYVIETGNLKRAGFVIPYIIFISIITLTIISLYSSSNLFDFFGIFAFILGVIIALRFFAILIVKKNVIKKYFFLLIFFFFFYIMGYYLNQQKEILGNQFQPLILFFIGIYLISWAWLLASLSNDFPVVIKEKYPLLKEMISKKLSSLKAKK